MDKSVGQVTRKKGWGLIAINSPKEIITHQQHMVIVDFGDQHKVMG